MQYSHCYCLLPIVVKSKPMISKLHLVSTQKFVWHACIVCVRFQGDKGILSFCLYDCLCLCAQLYQTTIIQRDVCVAQCPLCVEQPQPRQTMPHWSHTHSPAASGEDTKMMSRCLSITNFLSKLTTAICENDVSVASCSDRRKKSLSQLRLQEQSVMNLFKWESR